MYIKFYIKYQMSKKKSAISVFLFSWQKFSTISQGIHFKFQTYLGYKPSSLQLQKKNRALNSLRRCAIRTAPYLMVTRHHKSSSRFKPDRHGCFQKYGKTPKSSILVGFSIINHPFWGPTPIFGNTHMPFACLTDQFEDMVALPTKISIVHLVGETSMARKMSL